MRVIEKILDQDKQGLKCPFPLRANYITIHEVCSNQSAQASARYASRSNSPIAAHFFVDEKEAIQIIPLERNAFACGDGLDGTGNRESVSIEICRSQAKDSQLYKQSVQNALILTKQLMKELNLDAEHIVRHYDWTKADCPHRMMKEGRWQEFKMKCKEGEKQNEEFSI